LIRPARDKSAVRTASVFNSAMLVGAAVTIPLVTTGIYRVFLGIGSGMTPLVLGTLSLLLAFVVAYWRWLLVAARANPQITALVLLAPVSFVWSMHPPTTIERSVPLLVTSAFGLTLGAMLSLRQLLHFFALVMSITILASLAAIILVPSSQGIGTWQDAWNGIHNHKNGLGAATMLAATLSASIAMISRGRLRVVAIAVLVLALVLLIGSKSRTSQLMAFIVLSGLATGILFRRYALLWAVAFSTVALMLFITGALILGSSIAEPVFEALDRKPTLSGRLPLWSIVWPWITERPALGYGYMAFWRQDAPHVVAMASNPKLFFAPFYSHNAVLEVLLALGAAGLILLLTGIWKAFAALTMILRVEQDRLPAVCVFVVLVAILSLNITESFMLDRGHTGWIMFLAMTTSARLAAQKSRARHAGTARRRMVVP
jgi:O-antigen ligase